MFVSRVPFLLLLVFPLLELYLLIKAGGIFGAWPVVLWVIVVGLFGVSLIQSQGMATAERVRAALARGETPAMGMLEGLVMVVAGVLFLVPGLLSDAVALVLMIPPVRRAVIRRLIKSATGQPPRGPGVRPQASGERVLEGEYRREDQPPR
ncbi:MAG: FxsA family protein [Gammaproteobacteria bacterium]|nr:FxsA family protein [Gammaproteobacteria bacterium]